MAMCVKGPAGLCRESPFTALASAATFAVQMIGLTIHQVRRESIRRAGQRAASLLNIMALWDELQPLKNKKPQ